MAQVDARLGREDGLGATVPWVLVDDPENVQTALSDPVVDQGARDLLGAVAGLVPVSYDEVLLTYVGATDRVSTAVYREGGSTVATLTLGYDVSDRLASVARS